MNPDIEINRPEPISTKGKFKPFSRETDTRATIAELEAGNPVLIREFYSNGLLLLKEVQNYLKGKLPNKSFQEQREYRSEFRRLSNLVFIKIENHVLAVKKAPSIGWLEKLYPEEKDFLLPFPQVQGLNSAWQWYKSGISIPVLKKQTPPILRNLLPYPI